MCYFDTHLHYLKNDKSFKPSFVFIDHQPGLVCNVASIEPDSCMYLLGVSTDSLSDWVNRVQRRLNHVLTQGSKLDESGDWDQQANWENRGIPLWVRNEKLGSEALSLKKGLFRSIKSQKDRPLPSGSLLVGNQPRKRRRLLPSLRQQSRLLVDSPTRAMEMRRRRARKKRSRNRRSPDARQRRKRQRNRGPRKLGPGLHSSSQLVSPNQGTRPQSCRQRVRRPLLRLWVLRCKLFRR